MLTTALTPLSSTDEVGISIIGLLFYFKKLNKKVGNGKLLNLFQINCWYNRPFLNNWPESQVNKLRKCKYQFIPTITTEKKTVLYTGCSRKVT